MKNKVFNFFTEKPLGVYLGLVLVWVLIGLFFYFLYLMGIDLTWSSMRD